ncbi:hypothetical protein LEUCIP111803_01263 [Leucobacter soli]|uniref:HTH cro/C1-type domain-containing protein n=2 Tax=Leucobacter soli TaxID=2812850 RepID=A0A916NHH1_9MICO|nr:hypothetical protein LEUCIP111803_01263 [Leucobacter soli]
MKRVGTNVRFIRESHGISLAQLAARTGVAKSTLSQLEAGASNATLTTIGSVAGALSVDVAELVREHEEEQVVVVRRGDGADVSDQGSVGEHMRTALVGPSVLEFHRIRLDAGSYESSPSHGLGSREHLLVVSGALKAGPNDARIVARAGDYVSYPGDQVHHFEAVEGESAEYWIVATFPRTMGG